MNFTSHISEKIKNITIEKNIIHIGEVKKFNGNIVYTDPFPALNNGESSSMDTASSTESKLDPPFSRI